MSELREALPDVGSSDGTDDSVPAGAAASSSMGSEDSDLDDDPGLLIAGPVMTARELDPAPQFVQGVETAAGEVKTGRSD